MSPQLFVIYFKPHINSYILYCMEKKKLKRGNGVDSEYCRLKILIDTKDTCRH